MIYSYALDDMETGQAALLTAQALAGGEVTVNPRAEARKQLDEWLFKPLGSDPEEMRETWGLTPDAIAESAAADDYWGSVTYG